MKVIEGESVIREFFPKAQMEHRLGASPEFLERRERLSRALHCLACDPKPSTAKECVALMDKHGVCVRNGVISLD